MEKYPAEFSKFLEKTTSHLSLHTITTYINFSEQLSEGEKGFISGHLAECRTCMDSFELIFDENLELDGGKKVSTLFRNMEISDDDVVMFSSKNNQIEIEITKLDEKDFNLRFVSLPAQLYKENAALKAAGKHFLRVLSLDTDTMFIVNSDVNIMKYDLIEFITISESAVDQFSPAKETFERKKYYWYGAAAIIIIAALAVLYFVTRPASEVPVLTEENSSVNITTNEVPAKTSEITSDEKPEQVDENDQTDVNQTSSSHDYFAVNGKLESYVARGNRENSLVALVSPALGAEVQMPVTFSWMTSRKNVTLKFIILNNQNISVYDNFINGRELTIDTKLEPGLYYWELVSTDSIEALGKFLIK